MSQKQSKPPSKKAGPKTLEGSAEAKKIAAVILEVLAGLRATPDACNALEISVNRYYVLETRALQGLIRALEPLPRGRRKTTQDRVGELEREAELLRRELTRSQALMRSMHRSIGVPSPTTKRNGKQPKRKRRPEARAMRTIKALREGSDESSE